MKTFIKMATHPRSIYRSVLTLPYRSITEKQVKTSRCHSRTLKDLCHWSGYVVANRELISISSTQGAWVWEGESTQNLLKFIRLHLRSWQEIIILLLRVPVINWVVNQGASCPQCRDLGYVYHQKFQSECSLTSRFSRIPG